MAVLRKFFSRVALSAVLAVIPAVSLAALKPVVNPLTPVKTGVKSPVRLAVDGKGGFFLTDPRAGAILKYDLSGNLKATIPYKQAQGIAVTAGGDLVVSSGSSASIIDQAGNLKLVLGKGAGQFKAADGITIDSAGYIYVADSADNVVQVFNGSGAPVNMAGAANGKPANSFGTDGSGSGQFSMPTGLAFESSSGLIVVADTLNARVQFFDTSGIWKRSFGGAGSSLSFTMPVAVDFDYNAASGALQRLYVADSFQSGIQVIDPATAPVSLGYIGGYGKSAGKLMNPYGAVIDRGSSTLLVANGYGNVSIWGIDGGGSANPVVPGLSIDAYPKVTASAAIVLSGSVDSGVKLSASADTTATVGAVQVSGTAWTLAVSNLQAGLNIITVTATSPTGGTASATAQITYNPAAVGFILASVTTPTNRSSQTLTGSVDAGATVSVSVTAPLLADAVSYPTATTWSCTVSGLVVGDNVINASASLSGKTTSTATATITVKAAPSLTLFMAAAGSTVSSPLISVSGTTDSDITTVSINGVNTQATGGTFSRGIMLAGGSNSINVTVTDSLGSSTTRTRQITYDPVAPKVAISTPTAGAVINSLAPIPVQGTFSGSAASTIKVNGVSATISGSTWSATVSPVAGAFGINTVITDGAKTATVSTFVNIVDLTVPPNSISSPAADLLTNAATTAVSGNAKGAVLAVTINGVPLAAAFDPATGNYSAAVTPSADGTYLLAVTTTDAYGVSSSVYRTIVYKTAAPNLTVTAQSATAVSGTADPGATVYVRDASGSIIGSTQATSAGTWSIPLSGATPPLNIYALDSAGNNSRNGDINGSGAVDLADALRALKFSLGIERPTADELLRGDVAPLKNGLSMPDGRIDIDDVVLILMKVVGQAW